MAIPRLTGGLTPLNGADPRTFPGIFNRLLDLAEDLEDQVALAGGPNVGLTIVELEGGGWSGDAPPGRDNGENPITFVPYDPANPTDPAGAGGIASPQNIRYWDILLAEVAP